MEENKQTRSKDKAKFNAKIKAIEQQVVDKDAAIRDMDIKLKSALGRAQDLERERSENERQLSAEIDRIRAQGAERDNTMIKESEQLKRSNVMLTSKVRELELRVTNADKALIDFKKTHQDTLENHSREIQKLRSELDKSVSELVASAALQATSTQSQYAVELNKIKDDYSARMFSLERNLSAHESEALCNQARELYVNTS